MSSGRLLMLLCGCLMVASCRQTPAQGAAPTPTRTEQWRVEVVTSYPHDRDAFTQGLVLSNGAFFESTGLVGRSSLRHVEVETGRVIRKIDVPSPFFAEGLSLVGTRLFQLTWQDGQAFVYDAATFNKVEALEYTGEGWGLCYNDREFVMSDGSARLTFRGAETFRPVRDVIVRMNGMPVERLNELECVGGDVYANVWMTDTIVRIDAATGTVTAIIDASGLLPAAERVPDAVLNGIAYDPADRTFLITGKLWPRVFRVRFVPS
jgi:glutamine cyclotransferase